MSGVVPQVGQVAMLNSILSKSGGITFPLSLRLYSNDKVPIVGDIFTDYTVVSGGGYANVSIANGSGFTVSAGTPGEAIYSSFQDFNFTGAIGGSGNVYGYYILDTNNVLVGAERFSTFITPVNGSLVRIKPRIRLGNAS